MNAEPFCRLSIPTARLRIIGIDKKSKSISFFCCSLYTDELGVFMQKKYNVCLSVRPVQSVSVNPKSGMNILLGVRSEPKTH